MSFLVNICIFIIVAAVLTGSLVFPFMNLHLANGSLALVKTELNEIIAENRNNLNGIEEKITAKLSDHKAFELIAVEASDHLDFKIIEVEFNYKSLLQDMNEKVKGQKLRFIVNNV